MNRLHGNRQIENAAETERIGVIVGLTRYVRRGHLVHATLESIYYQTKDVLEAMQKDSGVELTALKVDGGALKNNYLTNHNRPDIIRTCFYWTSASTSSIGQSWKCAT